LRRCPLLHGIHCLARLVFKVTEERFHLALKVACLLPLLLCAFGLQAFLLATKLLLARLDGLAFALQFTQLGMKTVKELGHVLRLRVQARAGGLNDLRIQPQALGNVNARRSAGHANSQFVGRPERLLVKAHCGIEHASCVRGIYLQRGVMG